MGEWCEWTESERTLALEMYKDKSNTYQDIADAVNKTRCAVNGMLKRYRAKVMNNLLNLNLKELPEAEEEARRDCLKRGLNDVDAAKERKMSVQGFATWRNNRGLKSNNAPRKCKTKKVVQEKIILTAADVPKYYRCNKNNTTTSDKYKPSPVKIIVDPELVAQELNKLGIQRKMPLSEGQTIIVGNNIAVRGSKWDGKDNPKYNTTIAKQGSYADSVKRLVSNG